MPFGLKIMLACLLLPLTMLLFPLGANAADTVLSVTNNGKTHDYSLADLEAMPQTEVTTRNDYLDRRATFSGPLLRDVLAENDIGPHESVRMVALNDFSSEIPTSDAYDYKVILAIRKDGQTMPIREKGPIWVIYPMDDHSELRDDLYNGRLVWQLRSITHQ